MYTKQKRSNIIKLIIIAIIFQLLLPAGIISPKVYSKGMNSTQIMGMENDPYTGDLLNKVKTSPSSNPNTLNNGRAWLDKSVTKDSFNFEGDINIPKKENEFLVALSAISQSYPVKQEVKIPVDVVFLIDTSGSMASDITTGQTATQVVNTRAYRMVEALNKAIKTIMDANPEENRVAVVAYSGSSSPYAAETSTTTMLELTNVSSYPSQNYFECSGQDSSQGVSNLKVTSKVVSPNISCNVSGATPTQIGIYKGADILVTEPNTTYTYTRSTGQEVTINRKPAIVLLSDGEPTLGWTNYQAPSGTGDIGNGNINQPINFGSDFMTIVEAAHCKQKVSVNYNKEPSDYKEKNVGFYTIGVGVEQLPDISGTNTQRKQARSVLNPSQYASQLKYKPSGGAIYELDKLLDNFVGAVGSATIPVNQYGGWVPQYTKTINNLTEPNKITDWKYVDSYYSANNTEDLEDAFNQIATSIVNPGNYTTNWDPTQDPDYSGYLNVVDSIGTSMEFKEFEGFLYDGNLYTGEHFSQMLVSQEENNSDGFSLNPVHLRESLGLRLKIDQDQFITEIPNLIEGSTAGGTLYYNGPDDFGNSLKWYADSDLKYTGSYFNNDGIINNPPENTSFTVESYLVLGDTMDKVASSPTSLVYMTLHVVTAINNTPTQLKTENNMIQLNQNDQAALWETPTSIVPLYKMAESLGDDGNVTDITPEPINPVRAVYSVGMKPDTNLQNVSGSYLYSNNWSGQIDDFTNVTLASFNPNTINPYYYFIEDTDLYIKNGTDYDPAGTGDINSNLYYRHDYAEKIDGSIVTKEIYYQIDKNRTTISTNDDNMLYVKAGERKAKAIDDVSEEKNPDTTETYRYITKLNNMATTDNPALLVYLGNNGRMAVKTILDTAPITVTKVWEDANNPNRPTSVSIQLLANGEAYGTPITLSGPNWTHTWGDLPVRDENEELITYTVQEDPVPDGYNVFYNQPVWNEDTQTWSNATVTNRLQNSLTLQKTIIGLEESEIPENLKFTVTGEDDSEIIFSQTIEYTQFNDEGKYTLNDLQPGTYTVVEENADVNGYKLATTYEVDGIVKNDASATIGENNLRPNIEIINNYSPLGDLTISKIVSGHNADLTKEFEFTVTLTDGQGQALEGEFNYTGSKQGTIKSGDTITLKHGESIKIVDLPIGTKYRVTETESPDYTVKAENDTGVIMDNLANANFINTFKVTPPGPMPEPTPNPNPPKPNNFNSPKTGDLSNKLIWVSVMLSSVSALAGLLYLLNKKSKPE